MLLEKKIKWNIRESNVLIKIWAIFNRMIIELQDSTIGGVQIRGIKYKTNQANNQITDCADRM